MGFNSAFKGLKQNNRGKATFRTPRILACKIQHGDKTEGTDRLTKLEILTFWSYWHADKTGDTNILRLLTCWQNWHVEKSEDTDMLKKRKLLTCWQNWSYWHVDKVEATDILTKQKLLHIDETKATDILTNSSSKLKLYNIRGTCCTLHADLCLK